MAKVELRINQIIPTQKQLYPKSDHKTFVRSFVTRTLIQQKIIYQKVNSELFMELF
jgi:hypothetical protein